MSKILYFSAEWCGPCKAMKPILEKFEGSEQTVELVRIDADDNAKLTRSHEVSSIPTFILIDENNQEVRRHRGAMSEPDFITFAYGDIDE